MDLPNYVRTLQPNWLVVLACALRGASVGAGESLLSGPKGRAGVELYVSVRGESQASGKLVQGSNFAPQSVPSYVNIGVADRVLVPVIEGLNLDGTLSDLAERASVSAPLNSSSVDIPVTNADAAYAGNLANAIGVSLMHVVRDELEAIGGFGERSPIGLTIVQAATVLTSPVSPRAWLNALLDFAVGIVAGAAMSILRTAHDTRIHSRRDVEFVTDAPLAAKLTNGVILVVASGAARKSALQMAVRAIQVAGRKLRGIGVTMLPVEGPHSHRYRAFSSSQYFGGEEQRSGTNKWGLNQPTRQLDVRKGVTA